MRNDPERKPEAGAASEAAPGPRAAAPPDRVDYVERVNRAIDHVLLHLAEPLPLVPDEQPCFEAWAGRPFAHGTEHFELALQLPVR